MVNYRKEFSKIYDKCIDKIYRFIFLKVNSQEIAQDLTSETFLKGWEAFKKSQNPGHNNQKVEEGKSSSPPFANARVIENPSAFLYQIARNLVIDHYREKGKAQVISAEYIPIIDPKQDLEKKSLLESDIGQVRLALNGLKEDYQNVIIWHYLDDLPISKVAKMLDRTEETTRVLLHRALKTLKNKINHIQTS